MGLFGIFRESDKVLVDTDILYHDINALDYIKKEYKNVFVSTASIERIQCDIDGVNERKSDSAIKALKKIESEVSVGSINIDLNGVKKSGYSDILVKTAKIKNMDLCTENLLIKTIAGKFGIWIISLKDLQKDNDLYKGYKQYIFTSDEYNRFFSERQKYFSQFLINEYLIIKQLDGKSDCYRFTGDDFVPIKLPSSKVIKGENALQRCALDMLNNREIESCAILGNYGSGKSFLALRMALNAIRKGEQLQILGVREAVGEGHRIGYLKGDFEEKTKMFFKPLVHSLDGGEYEFQNLVQRDVLLTTVPYYLKGTTYNDTIIVCDEAEDLTEKQIKLVGTRLGKNSRIFWSGDYKQGVFDSSRNNPLVKMCQELKGNPKFACIYLESDVRSEASKMFANLFN